MLELSVIISQKRGAPGRFLSEPSFLFEKMFILMQAGCLIVPLINTGNILYVNNLRGIMRKAAKVEVIIVGNEILTGDILDTNTNWLCRLVHGCGGIVTRVTIVPDVLEVVSKAIRGAVSRKVDILFRKSFSGTLRRFGWAWFFNYQKIVT
jgi:hypothetical protein